MIGSRCDALLQQYQTAQKLFHDHRLFKPHSTIINCLNVISQPSNTQITSHNRQILSVILGLLNVT